MKTLNKYFTLIVITLIMMSTSMFAGGVDFEEENYINDIPFNTVEIFNNVVLTEIACIFEEEYIDDIPFNTADVAKELTNKEAKTVDFNFEEEEYINDIPFSTEELSQQLQLHANKCAK